MELDVVATWTYGMARSRRGGRSGIDSSYAVLDVMSNIHQYRAGSPVNQAAGPSIGMVRRNEASGCEAWFRVAGCGLRPVAQPRRSLIRIPLDIGEGLGC